ncbi:permease [Paenibacillus psychroresistens]|uniref:Permease n=1 Tax=Paenibacillus psychroresistens TaxID=1778678 RepID=A0A6B8RK38_9BACL|nr:permease [Paenibacillus psychroresistens]QGQ96399.1 permease [Paenibacillus psychroresistens]
MSYGYGLQSFKTIFISIILEAIPFILIGVLVSSFIHIFISDKIIQKYIPRDPMLAILFACFLGVLFPICECGLIPIVRRLVKKGMPLYVGIVFILVGPIINPVVFASTYLAFRTNPEMVYSRMVLALLVGTFIGLFIYYFVKKNALKDSEASKDTHLHTHSTGHPPKLGTRLLSMFEHAGSEFIDIGKYLVLGSLLTAAIQTLVSRASLIDIGQGQISSHLFMMGFAYILSLCSTSDAFVASSFTSTFSGGSLLAFLVFGPMLDFKSTLMLLSAFRAKFVLLLICLVALSVFVGSIIMGALFF